MIRRSCLAAALLAGALALSGAAAPEADVTGHWVGLAVQDEHAGGRDFHGTRFVDLTITRDAAGLHLRDDGAETMNARQPGQVTAAGRHVEMRWHRVFPSEIHAAGDVSPDGRTLDLTIGGEGMTGRETDRVVLHRDAGEALGHHLPRLAPDGHRVLDYSYRVPVARDDGLEVAAAGSVGLATAPLAAMVRSVLAEGTAADGQRTDSILVLRHGRLVLEEYFRGETARTPHIISSCTKSITSILAGIAADRGRFDPDERAWAPFAERTDTLWVAQRLPIDFGAVLSMTAGTRWRMQETVALLADRDSVGLTLNQPPEAAPGTRFLYDNGLPNYVSQVVARRMRMRFDDFAQQALFAPLGIRNDRWTTMPDGSPLGSGGLYLLPRDFARIGQMMLDRGMWQGRRIVSDRWIARSTRRQTRPGDYDYGYYWHLGDGAPGDHVVGTPSVIAIGQGGQILAILPKLDIVVVITSENWANPLMPFGLINDFVIPAAARAPG